MRTLVLDNGSHTIKAGFAAAEPDAATHCHTIPNCIARSSGGGRGRDGIFVADQFDQCKDTSEMAFRRPVEKGFVVSWDGELDVWQQVLLNDEAKLRCDPRATNLIVTEGPNCPQALQTATDQMIFEEFEFAAAYRCVAPSLVAWNGGPPLTAEAAAQSLPRECLLVVDSGYSHTTVTPLIGGRPVQPAVRRLDVGGKLLTNRLKELSSLRHWNLMDDSHLVSQIKEDACYVSHDFRAELEHVWNVRGGHHRARATGASHVVREYVLPDYRTTFRGHLRDMDAMATEQTSLPLGNERFVVPELLFRPSDIGIAQAGLPEVVVQSLSHLPAGMWPGLLANVVVVGGNAKIPGFVVRLRAELRAMVPSQCPLRVHAPDE